MRLAKFKGKKQALKLVFLLGILSCFIYYKNSKPVLYQKIVDRYYDDYDYMKKLTTESNDNDLANAGSQKCVKAVILTTINYPTEQVKYIRDAHPDWCVIVAGDKKTPRDWKYKNVIYLSVEAQEKLANKFKIISFIPYNSYLRKMVAYLYAIQNGAEHIYETDDDNAPLDGLLGFRYRTFKGLELDCFENENRDDYYMFVNPYAYFGQPTMWPRGYPLELISQSTSNYCKKYALFKSHETRYSVPLIQQGLVNGDPDVDAIYRLTRKHDIGLLNVKFDEYAPPLVLKPFQYAPINSQNTLYHYEAFWTMAFQLNVTFRECDILRGYISMRMLQEIDGQVAFIAPNTLQIRNAHSYHADYKDEKRLYEDIQEFVGALHEWKCVKSTISECYIDCVKNLIVKKFLKDTELNFVRLWIEALNSIGYKWPSLFKRRAINKNKKSQHFIFYTAVEQAHSSNSNKNQESLSTINNRLAKMKFISDKCQSELKLNTVFASYDKAMLVVDVKTAQELDLINLFVSVHFQYISLCINQDSVKLNLTEYLKSLHSYSAIIYSSLNGSSFNTCMRSIFDVGFKHQAYIVIASIKKFKFWSTSIQLTENNHELGANSDSVYFVRKNVARGVRHFKFLNDSKFSLYCDHFKQNKHLAVLDSFVKAIDDLIMHQNDLPAENCQNLQAKTVWHSAIHLGTMTDVTSVLAYMGQNPIIAWRNDYGSWYPETIPLVKLVTRLSNYLKSHLSQENQELTRDMMEENYDFYKNDPDFANVDFVICTFLPKICEGFIPLNKTIIMCPAQRYNIGRCDKKRWKLLNKNIHRLMDKSKLVMSAMSQYDVEYMAHFTGLRQYKLFAYGGFYAKNIIYNTTKEEILVGPTSHLGPSGDRLLAELQKKSLGHQLRFSYIREMYPHYTLQQLASHRAIVLFPYAVMTYSIVDYYISNIPLFVPSIEMLNKAKNLNERTLKHPLYCGSNVTDIKPHPNSFHKHSPNDDSDEALKYWLTYADYYQWPFITVFESFDDLLIKLKTLDLNEISNKMKKYNKVREAILIDNWCRVLKHDTRDQSIPKSFNEAMSYFRFN